MDVTGPRRSVVLDTTAALEMVRATRTAQDVYDQMLSEHITPALRSRGMTGARGRYRLPSPDWWAMLGFQKHKRNDASRVRFAIGLTVVARTRWEAGCTVGCRTRPIPEPGAASGVRLGTMPLRRQRPEA